MENLCDCAGHYTNYRMDWTKTTCRSKYSTRVKEEENTTNQYSNDVTIVSQKCIIPSNYSKKLVKNHLYKFTLLACSNPHLYLKDVLAKLQKR